MTASEPQGATLLNREDIESFLIRAEVSFEELDDDIWLVSLGSEGDENRPRAILSYQPPVLVLRADICESPADKDEQLELYRRLLELNATDLIHGAYGVEDGDVILSDTMQLADLDFSEFRASAESISLALTTHWAASAASA